jgi:hypothetical protein
VTPPPAASPRSARNGAPRRVRQAALVTAVEGVVLLGFAGYVAVQAAVSSTDRLGDAVALAAVTAGAGLLLGALARALAALRAWARTPVAVVQVLFLPVGVSLVQAGRGVVGAGVLVLAVAELVLLFTPQSRAALDR